MEKMKDLMWMSNLEMMELVGRENTSVRCWKCLRLIRGESHECFQQAKRFVVKYEGDYRGTMGEFYSAYPLSQEEMDRLGGEIDEG